MDPPNAHTFIVRLWLERREIEGAPPEWRGRIDHVGSGGRFYFLNLSDCVQFIQAYLNGQDETATNGEGDEPQPFDGNSQSISDPHNSR